MLKEKKTNISPLVIKQKAWPSAMPAERLSVDWPNPPKPTWGESLLKNFAVASALALFALTLRTGALPELSSATDAILTAATDQSLLDDQLGKLSFVSSLFPEAVLVFGERHVPVSAMPVSGGTVIHAWSATEPYVTLRSDSEVVVAAIDGEVVGLYHGHEDERLVRIAGADGLTCLYGNLANTAVQLGDAVNAGDLIGTLGPEKELVFELLQDGISIMPWNAEIR